MRRTRLSTTVDTDLLDEARGLLASTSDAKIVDEALTALVGRYRAARIDDAYAVYERQPMDGSDEWGDLDSWLRAADARG